MLFVYIMKGKKRKAATVKKTDSAAEKVTDTDSEIQTPLKKTKKGTEFGGGHDP